MLSVCRIGTALLLTLLPTLAVAQIPGSELPGRARERFVDPPVARAQPRGPVVSLPSTVAPPGAESIMLTINGVQITGMTVYRPDELAYLWADLTGREVSLQAVYDLAQRITAKYGRDGYVLSRAIVPPQNLSRTGAVIQIQVVEGYVDRVVWPAKLARYRDFFTEYEAKIVADRPANIRTLERYLLLLGDLPGFKVSTKLEPSKTNLAASTLVVEVTEKQLDFNARFDNHGSKARGPAQFYGSATLNNVLGAHEAFSLTYAGAFETRELQYAAGAWRQVLNSEGLYAFANYSYSWGRPGTEALELLKYKTRATYGEAGLAYPVIRAREENLLMSAYGFVSDADGIIFDDPLTAEHARPAARRPAAGRRRPRRPARWDQPVQLHRQQGLRRPGFDRERQSAGVARERRRRLHQVRVQLRPAAAAVLELLALRVGVRPMVPGPAAVARAVRLWRPVLRAGLRSVRAGG
jgi:hemolysin activation/secretion protein